MENEVERFRDQAGPPTLPTTTSINLGSSNLLDLSGLTEEQVGELKRQHASGMIDLKRKAEELKMDVGALSMGLGALNDEAAKATQANVSMTLTHTQTTSFGRTEVVMGNTDRAASGKLSSSATGTPDRTIWIIGAVLVCAVIIAIIVTRH